MRTIRLPTLVDGAKARATFPDAVLEVILPRLEHAKRHTPTIEKA